MNGKKKRNNKTQLYIYIKSKEKETTQVIFGYSIWNSDEKYSIIFIYGDFGNKIHMCIYINYMYLKKRVYSSTVSVLICCAVSYDEWLGVFLFFCLLFSSLHSYIILFSSIFIQCIKLPLSIVRISIESLISHYIVFIHFTSKHHTHWNNLIYCILVFFFSSSRCD